MCLDLAQPILMERAERAYDWIRDAGITVPEVLLVPLGVKGADALGTLWLVATITDTSTRSTPRVIANCRRSPGWPCGRSGPGST